MNREYLRIGEILVGQGLLTSDQVAQALESQRQNRTRFGEIVVTMGWVTEEDLARALGDQYHFDYVDANAIEPESDSLLAVSGRWALTKLILPHRKFEGRFEVVIADPLDVATTDEIRSLQELPLKIFVAGPIALRSAIIRHYTLECDLETAATHRTPSVRPRRIDWQTDRAALLGALDRIMEGRRGAA